MPDPIFADPRLAELYDLLDGERDDLDHYLAIVEELGARSVLDVGCGTGSFACLLAARGMEVVGVDPAAASLDVARRKPDAHRVRWIDGDATSLPPMQVDLATMTANVAQVFVDDESWTATLRAVRSALRPGGRFVFETRDPARAWEEWVRDSSTLAWNLPDGRRLVEWADLVEVALPLVTFRWTFEFDDGLVLTSDSTLRFRGREEIESSLSECGFAVDGVRDAPDRPGKEWVFVARAVG